MQAAKQQTDETPTDVFARVRASTLSMCAGLTPEDCNLQAMPETSPVKWHLAHTTWFFETFVLVPFNAGYRPVHPSYETLFNSYYNGVGEQYPRPQRGLLSRPTLAEVYDYRNAVDAEVMELLNESHHPNAQQIQERVLLGLHHEAQHQELMLTDLKYCLFQNPLFPVYREQEINEANPKDVLPLRFIDCVGGVREIGHEGEGFSFDNEAPRHSVLVAPFRLANRLVTNGEFLEFVSDGGYTRPDHWLSDGWIEVQQRRLRQPLYWSTIDGQRFEYTLGGLQPLDTSAPVSHVSYFEAQAYACWAGKRLATEAEWESTASQRSLSGNFLDSEILHPRASQNAAVGVTQLYGDCWEWTNSAYLPYPGYKPAEGAIGEYNGKFMSGQMVLRGGSCMSRAFHVRSTYRNFFYPPDRWQCTGIRLADDLH